MVAPPSALPYQGRWWLFQLIQSTRSRAINAYKYDRSWLTMAFFEGLATRSAWPWCMLPPGEEKEDDRGDSAQGARGEEGASARESRVRLAPASPRFALCILSLRGHLRR